MRESRLTGSGSIEIAMQRLLAEHVPCREDHAMTSGNDGRVQAIAEKACPFEL